MADSFHGTLDAAMARAVFRPVICVACKMENVVESKHSSGHIYCRCLTCGTRFWHR